ncbi:MAG: PD-(D/E)XK nuclease family protein [Flavobacteriales bacterium]|nr:PD-(D/E)XK nuclease family protein [Flavobacteriales bacterium]
MTPFLRQVVDEIKKNHSENIGNICLVLPSRRSKIFLKNHFHEAYKKTMWLPEMYSIEEFIHQLSGYSIIDGISQIFEFYTVYSSLVKTPDSFDEFCKWAPTLLQDFNEIDSYMIDHQELFSFINETHAMEVWNVDGSEITAHQKQYLAFWSSFLPLYENYSKHLKSKRQAYQGLAFRDVAENLNSNSFTKWDKIYFVGFNALNKAEETIIEFLSTEKKCEMLWDSDSYYLGNEAQEAGMFLRKFAKKWDSSPFNWTTTFLNSAPKTIQITGVAGDINQVKLTANILAKEKSGANYQDTAVVLADENLLMPMLESLPDEVEHVNITMGYPLKNTPLHSFWMACFTLHENGHKYSKTDDKPTFHYKDVLRVLYHQSIRNKQTETLANTIIKRNLVFIPHTLIAELIEGITSEKNMLHLVLSNWKNQPQKARSSCNSMIEILSKQISKKQKLELEYLFTYHKIFNRLDDLIERYHSIPDLKTLKTLFNQIVGQESIPFFGEPLRGLQLMGMLETRTLDFKNVILISTNEGTIPAGKSQNSFIPYDIKRKFKLPTHIEKDAIFAYHFYRLLQRAEKVHLLYNSNTEGLNTGERSRFITQLQHEVGKNITIEENHLSFTVPNNSTDHIQIFSTEAIRNRLAERAVKGFSPSGLNAFIRCPLDFYYKYVLGLKEIDEVEETIESSSLGTFVHDTLEYFYKPYTGKVIHSRDIEGFLPKVTEALFTQFRTAFSENEINHGKNLLIFNVAKKFVNNFLQQEIKFLKSLDSKGQSLTILKIEETLEADFEHNGINFKLTGKADRIDRYGNTIRIVDYKTGLVQRKNVTVTDLTAITSDEKLGKAFQLLAYALLYKRMNPEIKFEIISGNISFRKLSQWLMPVSINKQQELSDDVLNDFETELKQLIGRIFDPEMHFKHNDDAQYCNFCDI